MFWKQATFGFQANLSTFHGSAVSSHCENHD